MRLDFHPREYQKLAVRYLLDHSRCTLVADPGLGKTGMALMALDILQLTDPHIFPALVLAPKRVADVVWTTEARRWSTFENLSVVQVTGTAKQREDILRRPRAAIYVCNYELVEWLVSVWPQNKWPFRIVIADESSRLKSFRLHGGGKRAAALAKIALFTERWYNLTGTPMPNGAIDLWGPQWFIDQGAALKRSFTAYKEAFFIENPYNHTLSLQQGAEASIHDALAATMIAFRAEDWLDIQKPQEIAVDVQLPPKARADYERMEREYFLEIGDEEIEAGTGAIKSSKLLQMASGSVYDTNGDAHAVHDAKIEALADIVEQINAPLLVAYQWRFDLPRILKAFPKARLYSDELMGDWNAGKIPIMLLHMQSAHGLNLHRPCRDICFYSYNWSAENWQQMIERVGPARQAQLDTKRVTRVWTIRARGTIDTDVVDSNERKISVEQALKRARARRYV